MKKSLMAVAMLACCMAAAGENGSDTGGTGAGVAMPPAPPAKVKKARLLMDCEHGKCNDLVTLPADVAEAAAAAGHADVSKGAIAYAESLPQNRPRSAVD